MSKSKVNGYLLVSKEISVTNYRGVDREPWDYIDQNYYEKKLPDEVHNAYEEINNVNERDLWWPTCEDKKSLLPFIEFLQGTSWEYDLIAVYSQYLEGTLGRAGHSAENVIFLGFDVISVGEWSLIKALLEAEYGVGTDIANYVNENGLLSESSNVKIIEEKYRAQVERNVVEPIAYAGSGTLVEPVYVYWVDDGVG